MFDQVSAKESESPLHQLYTKLEEICDSCGLLTSPTNDNKVKIENQIENQVENQVEHKEDHKEEETLDCQRFYLKKPLQGRCFTPGSSDGKVDVKVDVRSDGKGFISLESISASGSAEAAVAAPTRSSRYYTSMRIKRLEPNANKANAKKMKKQWRKNNETDITCALLTVKWEKREEKPPSHYCLVIFNWLAEAKAEPLFPNASYEFNLLLFVSYPRLIRTSKYPWHIHSIYPHVFPFLIKQVAWAGNCLRLATK